MKKALAIGATKNLSFAIGTFVINILDKCKSFDEIIIFYDDSFTEQDINILQHLTKIRLIKFDPPSNYKTSVNIDVLNYFTIMVLCKFECFKLLSEYDVIVWSDVDVVILSDISELFEINHPFQLLKSDTPLNNLLRQYVNTINQFFCSGLITMTNELPYQDMYNTYHQLSAYEKLRLPDQYILNTIIDKYNLYSNIKCLDFSTYCCKLNEVQPNTKILHSYGSVKFWHVKSKPWLYYYNQWVQLGGSVYQLQENK